MDPVNHIKDADDLVFCCDWGTSNLRIQLVQKSNYEVIWETHSDDGIAKVFSQWQMEETQTRPTFYASFLRSKIKESAQVVNTTLHHIPILISGMASSSIGFAELPYARLPFPADGRHALVKHFEPPEGLHHPITIISGIQCDSDVMRGEETQLVGLMERNKNEELFENKNNLLFIFPGTHSKHILLKDNGIVDFKTFMTGELFNILCHHSLLRTSVEISSLTGAVDDHLSPVREGAAAVLGSRPSLLHSLFTVRVNQLLGKLSARENYFFLSGMLIGSELRYLLDEEHSQMVVCAPEPLLSLYKTVISQYNLSSRITFLPEGELSKATITGQIKIYSSHSSAASSRHQRH